MCDETNQPILLFDGECNLCNHWVDFLLRNEKKKWFLFASLQSEKGKKIVHDFQIPSAADSVVVILNDEVFLYSDAVLQVVNALPWYYGPLKLVRLMPKNWRDRLYKLIAKNRYRLFGKRQTCRVPTREERSRFLS
ncbi:DUF393 domain-containing protein [bacterium LRH843]|nr:DUF393 domain-containing protein [bacterium LRH843]